MMAGIHRTPRCRGLRYDHLDDPSCQQRVPDLPFDMSHWSIGPDSRLKHLRLSRRLSRPKRPPPPTRDPNTPGYVKAKELPDGAVPSPKENGNFIIGPTHNPAPEMSVKEGVPQGQVFEFTMESKDSKIYPGIAREPGTFARPDPADPSKLIVNSHPAPYTRKVAVYVPEAVCSRHGGAVHRRRGWTGPDAVHRARQSDRRETGAR